MRGGCVVEPPLDVVVLVVAPGIVHRPHLCVAQGRLPQHHPQTHTAHEVTDVAIESVVIGAVPPARPAVAVDDLLEGGVAVGRIGEDEIEARAERLLERDRPGGQGIYVGQRRVLGERVGHRAPHGQLVAEKHVGRVLVAEPDEALGETVGVVGEPRHVRVAATGHGGRDGRSLIGRGRLLDVAPQVRLDVHDDRL